MKCYYAHPITSYGSDIEKQDIVLLESLGFDVLNPNQPEYDIAYKEQGMTVFLELVDSCDMVAFRAFPDGSIPAGIAKEVFQAGIKPVIELPTNLQPRVLNVEQTRAQLKFLGRKI